MRDIVYYVAFLDVIFAFLAILWNEPLMLLTYLLINSLIVVALAYMVLEAEKEIERLKESR